MKDRRSPALREIFINAILIFVTVTVVGMISNVLILLVGWFTSLPVTASLDAQGYTEAEQQTVWLILAVISMLTCMICSFLFTHMVGARAAQYRVGYKLSRKIGIPSALFTVGSALIVHGLCCAVLANMSMAYLVIASPVQYIARFLGHGENTLFIEEAFDFGMEYVWTALAVYLVLLALTCMTAYTVGFIGRIRAVERKERDDAASARYEERKARLEAEGRTGGVSNTSPEWKPEIKRETLSGKTEKRLRELNRVKIIQTAVFLVLWIAADILMWYLWARVSGRDMLSPTAFIFTLLLIIPFWPMKKYEVFVGKTYYAEVADIRTEERVVLGTGMTGRGRRIEHVRAVYLRPKGGASEKLVFKEKDMLSFKPGDHVLKLSAFKYPVNCNFDDAHDVYCMNCGQSNNPGRKRCVRCCFTLGREK